jgi:hypothetical protein
MHELPLVFDEIGSTAEGVRLLMSRKVLHVQVFDVDSRDKVKAGDCREAVSTRKSGDQ